jgi:hypothetical protein
MMNRIRNKRMRKKRREKTHTSLVEHLEPTNRETPTLHLHQGRQVSTVTETTMMKMTTIIDHAFVLY